MTKNLNNDWLIEFAKLNRIVELCRIEVMFVLLVVIVVLMILIEFVILALVVDLVVDLVVVIDSLVGKKN